jgi:hypothetical protein
VLRAALFAVLVSQAPEAPVQAPSNLSAGSAPAAPAEPVTQRPAGAELSPGTAAPAPALEKTPVTTTPTPTPRARVVRPKPGEGDVVAPAGPQPANDGMARYYRAPFAETVWPKVVGRDVLLVLGTGARVCVTLTRKTRDALYYTHRKNGAQQAPMTAVTSIHENSWECNKDYDSTPSEWARSGTAGGLTLSAIGAVMGVLSTAFPRTCTTDMEGMQSCTNKFMPIAYSVIGVTTTTLGTPIVAAGGYSTSRDLRVKGKIWARATGWVLYSAGTLMNALWLVGTYAKVDALDAPGLTTGAGLLGLGGSAFMAVDSLSARNELAELLRKDSTPATQGGPTARRSSLGFGARPVGFAGQMHGLTFGVGGRF